MKKILAVSFLTALVVLACTNKEIKLITNVELEFSQDYQNEGFVNALLPATFTITPEVILPEFVYYFQYEVAEGAGVFLNADEEVLPEGELIVLERATDDATNFLLNLHYKPSVAGRHIVKMTASDNFEKAIPFTALYDIKNQPIKWEAATPLTTVELGEVVPITITLENASADQELTFERSYRYTEGSGSLSDDAGAPIVLGTKTDIVPGTYTINALANQIGITELSLVLEDSNGQLLTQTITFEVTQEVSNTEAIIQTFVIDQYQGVITENSIEVVVPTGTEVTALTPIFTLSSGASSTPTSGTMLDFSTAQTIIVTAEDQATTVNYTVTIIERDIPVTTITTSQENLSMIVGSTQTITATVLPDNATDPSVVWTTDDETVAIVTEGVVKAIAVGETIIRVASNADPSVVVEIPVMVSAAIIPITGITITSTTNTATVGDPVPLTIAYTPEEATTAAITWSSSDETKATISPEGVLTTLEAGSVTITALLASDNSIKDTFTLEILPRVTPITVLQITPEEQKVDLNSPDPVRVMVTVAPVEATEGYSLSSSDSTIATVAQDGTITKLKPGNVTITATADADAMINASASLEIILNPIAITIEELTEAIKVGDSKPLVISYDPLETTERDVMWESNRPAIASVDENGELTALSPGEAMITATTVNGKTSKITIIVEAVKVPVTSITLNTDALRIDFDNNTEDEKLIATVLPADATDPTLEWFSSDPMIADVDNQGNIDPKATGEVTITARSVSDPEIEASATVTMYISVFSVSLEPVTLFEEETIQLTPIFNPTNSTNQNVTWSIDDPTIATIDENGLLTALKAGTTMINVIAEDGGKTTSVPLTVNRAIVLIPDPIFEERLRNLGFDTNPLAGQIYKSDALASDFLDLFKTSGAGGDLPSPIMDYTGIESFENLKAIWCSLDEPDVILNLNNNCLLYTSPSPRD